ncbi:hypothetical protein EZ242_07390 [Ramlibacter rhizophilus]|uniref:Uncharacterized protein n=1 Tax=Ramlibacter rhizophilus TaxID=1781167 RepID=A0A4Z0BQT8_9BURK|nr:hypothetical protein EZ242_07390 [Ramlibacter rhizophilus]
MLLASCPQRCASRARKVTLSSCDTVTPGPTRLRAFSTACAQMSTLRQREPSPRAVT